MRRLSPKRGLGLALTLAVLNAACVMTSYSAGQIEGKISEGRAPYPGIYVAATSENTDYAELLEETGLFEEVSESGGGFPIGLRFRETEESKLNAGLLFTMLLLSASTLLAVPIIGPAKRETSVSVVLGEDVEKTFRYEADITRFAWIIGVRTETNTIEAMERAVASDAVAQLVRSLQSDPEMAALFEAYRESQVLDDTY